LGDGEEPPDFQLRFKRGTGVFWASVQIRIQPEEVGGEQPEYRVTFTDTEELKQAQESERRIAERFRAVVEGSHDIIYSLDPHGIIQFVSPACRVLGYEPSDFVGRSFEQVVDPDDTHHSGRALAKAVADATADAVVEYRVQRADGNWRWFESNIAPVTSPQGEVIEYVGNARDITERKFEAARMQTMAMTDELTQIGNRRLLMADGAKEFKRSRRYHYSLSLLMIDVDNLKLINDSHGHGAGDHALQIVARVCGDTCREFDTAGRLGGDEFVILLPHSSSFEAFDIGERVREAIELEPQPAGLPEDFKVTVSIGVGTMEPGDTEFGDSLERADVALHRAKVHGRNWTSV